MCSPAEMETVSETYLYFPNQMKMERHTARLEDSNLVFKIGSLAAWMISKTPLISPPHSSNT